MATIAVLGTGIMGAPIARNLAAAGFTVQAWNRTIEKARPLAGGGVVICAAPREAAADAEFVLTMLADVDAVDSVVGNADGPFAGAAPPVWLQMSTVDLDGTERLASFAADRGVPFVDAPVLGTREPAENAALT